MTILLPDTRSRDRFIVPPVAPSPLLTPIRTWLEMYRESLETGVVFDAFWYESVVDGTACFFRWTGEPRATVVAIYSSDGVLRVECRKRGGAEPTPAEMVPMRLEVTRVFAEILAPSPSVATLH